MVSGNEKVERYVDKNIAQHTKVKKTKQI